MKLVWEKGNGIDGSWNFFLFHSESDFFPHFIWSTNENWHLELPPFPPLLAIFKFNVCFSTKINMFSAHDLLVREFRSFLEPEVCSGRDDYWIIAYSSVEFPFLDYTRLYSLYFFGRKTQSQWSIFFSLPWPSLNNDSLGPWDFASYSHLGATLYPCFYFPFLFCLDPLYPLAHGICLWGYCQRDI